MRSPERRGRPAKGEGAALVYAALRREILSLELAPGVPLDEAALVERFGLSRTPVREALLRLGAEHLVRWLPNRGAQVAPLDLTDFPRYVEALDLAQRAVTRFVAARRTEGAMAAIDEARERFETAVGAGDPLDLTERNRDFHLAIAAAAANPYLARHYERLLDEGMRWLRIPLAFEPHPGGGRREHVARIVAEHRDMADAVRERDPERADALAHAHTELFRRRMLAYLGENRAAGMVLASG